MVVLIPVLVNIAFITLLERKVLGYRQRRLGPNKVGVGGFIQPFADAVKLFLKRWGVPQSRNLPLYMGAPAGALFLVLLVWQAFPDKGGRGVIEFSLIFVVAALSLGVYPLLIRG